MYFKKGKTYKTKISIEYTLLTIKKILKNEKFKIRIVQF